jgi:hypothetical protein
MARKYKIKICRYLLEKLKVNGSIQPKLYFQYWKSIIYLYLSIYLSIYIYLYIYSYYILQKLPLIKYI